MQVPQGTHSCRVYAGVEPAVLNGGAVLCHPDWPVPLVSRIVARLLVLDISRPILRGQQVTALHGCPVQSDLCVEQVKVSVDPSIPEHCLCISLSIVNYLYEDAA